VGKVQRQILLDGVLAPLQSVIVRSPFEGDLVQVLEQGSAVTKGETLAVLDTFEIEQLARRADFEEKIKKMEFQKLQLEHQIEELEDQDSFAKREKESKIQQLSYEQKKYARNPVELLRTELEMEKHLQMIGFYTKHLMELEKLGNKGALSSTELADERLRFQEYKIRLEQLKLEFETLREGDPSAIEKARRDLEKAQVLKEFAARQLEENQKLRELSRKVSMSDLDKLRSETQEKEKALANSIIRAPEDGVFLMRDHWVGDGFGTYKSGHRISDQALLGEISKQSLLKGKFQAREVDLTHLKTGQEVLYQVTPLGNQWFKGKISKIEKVLQEVATWQKDLYAMKTASVEMELLETSPLMKPKMTLLARVITGAKESKTRVPHECISSGHFLNSVKRGRIPIETGLQGRDYAEVLKGIKAGEEIFCDRGKPFQNLRWNQSTRAKPADIYRSARGSGVLHSRREILLSPAFTSSILKILDSGTEVQAGEALIVLDTKNKETELQAKEIELTEKKVDHQSSEMLAQQKLEGIKEGIAEAKLRLRSEETQLQILMRGGRDMEIEKQKIQLTLAEVEKKFQNLSFEVQEVLKERGYLKSKEYQGALEQLKNSEIQKRISTLELELKQSPASSREIGKQSIRVSHLKNSLEIKEKIFNLNKEKFQLELALSQLGVQKAEFEVASLRAVLNRAVLKAPQKGVFLIQDHWAQGKMVPYKTGDSVRPGSLVGRLVELDEFYISGKLEEEAFHLLKAGQKVSFILSGRKDRQFPGTLEHISPVPIRATRFSRREGEPQISVEISVQAQSRTFQPGASVNYEIMVSEPMETLTIPIGALFQRDGKFYVFVQPSHHGLREVKTGIQHLEEVEIRSGLQPGETIYWESLE